jgi:RNA polymerase sigma-70 factor (ECF subfamily)
MMTEETGDLPSTTTVEEVQLLFVKNQNLIRAFVRSLQPTLSDSDDIVQETFLTVTQKSASYEPGTNFVAWACTIARYKVLEHLRKRKRDNHLSEAAIIALSEDAPAPELFSEKAGALEQCVTKLSPKLRDLTWRRYSSRQSSQDMAKAAGMTPNAVRIALTKARNFLRKCVKTELKKIAS